MKNNDIVIQISSSYFVAGIKLKNNIVIEGANILKFMEGWTLERVKEYCKDKGWDYLLI